MPCWQKDNKHLQKLLRPPWQDEQEMTSQGKHSNSLFTRFILGLDYVQLHKFLEASEHHRGPEPLYRPPVLKTK